MCTEEHHEKHIWHLTEKLRFKRERPLMYTTEDKEKKRRAFIDWYMERYQNDRTHGQMVNELSDLLFLSVQYIYRIIKK